MPSFLEFADENSREVGVRSLVSPSLKTKDLTLTFPTFLTAVRFRVGYKVEYKLRSADQRLAEVVADSYLGYEIKARLSRMHASCA